MDDDFNTADAVSAVFEYVKFCNTNVSGENSKAYIDALYAKLKRTVRMCWESLWRERSRDSGRRY